VGNDDQFRRFCGVVRRPELAQDPRFAANQDRVRHYDALRAVLEPVLAAWERHELLTALTGAGVPSAAVRTVTDALADPQLAARDMIVPLEHATAGAIRVLGTPVKLSATPASIRTPPPTLGQHTRKILKNDAGLSEEEIVEFVTAAAADGSASDP
jgi:crotonobetainyl-CoA:carnitine CoA-transferase CaiB-like acyl-CoA transferase